MRVESFFSRVILSSLLGVKWSSLFSLGEAFFLLSFLEYYYKERIKHTIIKHIHLYLLFYMYRHTSYQTSLYICLLPS